jgi:hypothetical protein
MLSSAMENLQSYDYFYLLAVKDYVKVLLQLSENDTAIQVITANIERAKEYPDYEGIFQIMYSVALDDPTYAESVVDNLSMSVWVRRIACNFLTDYYSSKGDSESLLRYYEKGRRLSSKKNQYFEEGF